MSDTGFQSHYSVHLLEFLNKYLKKFNQLWIIKNIALYIRENYDCCFVLTIHNFLS